MEARGDEAAGPDLGRAPARAWLRATIGLVVVVVLLIATTTATTPANADFTPVSAQGAAAILRRSTVQIMAFGCAMERNDATAVAVPGGLLLTNEHVVAGSRLVDVVAQGEPTEVGGAAAVAVAGDVATIAQPASSLAPVPLAPQDPPAGSVVRVAGYPSALPGQPDPGFTIVATRVVDYVPGAALGQPWPVMRLATTVRTGMSGGPVLDASGNLAGIVFGDEEPTGLALVIPASQLRRLLTTNAFVAVAC